MKQERVDRSLCALIDHTLLAPGVTCYDIERLCREALSYKFAAVVVPPFYIGQAAELLRGSGVAVASVVAFPLGLETAGDKAAQIERLVARGAEEVDVVMNIGAFLSRRYDVVRTEMWTCAKAAAEVVTKLIVETGLLDREGIVRAAEMAAEAGFDYVKTCTGYGPRGVMVDDVVLIRSVVGRRAKVKAAGGIRSGAFARELVQAGAERLGCSRSLEIVGAVSGGK